MSDVEGPPETLHREILACIETWHTRGECLSDDAFNDLALRIFAYQLARNKAYARFAATRGVTLDTMPQTWEQIPPMPAAAYKEATLATFDSRRAALVFETSGTTSGSGGRHYMERSTLYDAALLAGFDRFMLHDGARLRYLNLVPNPQERPHSSLGYMMARVAERRGDGKTGWYVRGETLAFDAFFADLQAAIEARQPVCIATTAFALFAALEEAEARGLRLALAPGSRIMETGGFKGRTRVVPRDELYARACTVFGIAETQIVAEYGMTELTSQWYDCAGPSTSRASHATLRMTNVDAEPTRRKAGPAWLRARAIGPNGATLPDGVVGALVHVDLANLFSCIAVQTEDLGARFGDEIVLLGRESSAELRGCSIDAESLAAR